MEYTIHLFKMICNLIVQITNSKPFIRGILEIVVPDLAKLLRSPVTV